MCFNYTSECCVGAVTVTVELLWQTRTVGAGLIVTFDGISLFTDAL